MMLSLVLFRLKTARIQTTVYSFFDKLLSKIFFIETVLLFSVGCHIGSTPFNKLCKYGDQIISSDESIGPKKSY